MTTGPAKKAIQERQVMGGEERKATNTITVPAANKRKVTENGTIRRDKAAPSIKSHPRTARAMRTGEGGFPAAGLGWAVAVIINCAVAAG